MQFNVNDTIEYTAKVNKDESKSDSKTIKFKIVMTGLSDADAQEAIRRSLVIQAQRKVRKVLDGLKDGEVYEIEAQELFGKAPRNAVSAVVRTAKTMTAEERAELRELLDAADSDEDAA